MSRFHVGTFVPVPAPDGQVCNVLGFAKCMYDGRLLEPLWVCVTDDASVIVMPLDKFTGGGRVIIDFTREKQWIRLDDPSVPPALREAIPSMVLDQLRSRGDIP